MWDAIVVGGGPAGSQCAAGLARHGWSVLLAEAGNFTKPRLADTLGATAARRLRRALPPGPESETAMVPCRGLLAQWGMGDPQATDYELEQCGPGCVVMRPSMDRLLFRAAGADGAALALSWRCLRLEADRVDEPARAVFWTPQGRTVEGARLIVVATGRTRVPGAPKRIYLDRQLAFAAIVDQRVETHGLLCVESSEDGWWYLVRLSDTRAQVVFVTERRPAMPGLPARLEFLACALDRTRSVRAALNGPPAMRSVSVHDARASRPADHAPARVLPIGDAAGTIDPLSGQGWMAALESGAAAAEQVSHALRRGRVFDPQALHRADVARFTQHLAGRDSMWARAGLAGPFHALPTGRGR